MAKKVKAGKALAHRGTPVTRTTAKEWKEIRKEIERTYAYLRKKYPEIHGKVAKSENLWVSGNNSRTFSCSTARPWM